jgi:hypothetical protein
MFGNHIRDNAESRSRRLEPTFLPLQTSNLTFGNFKGNACSVHAEACQGFVGFGNEEGLKTQPNHLVTLRNNQINSAADINFVI